MPIFANEVTSPAWLLLARDSPTGSPRRAPPPFACRERQNRVTGDMVLTHHQPAAFEELAIAIAERGVLVAAGIGLEVLQCKSCSVTPGRDRSRDPRAVRLRSCDCDGCTLGVQQRLELDLIERASFGIGRHSRCCRPPQNIDHRGRPHRRASSRAAQVRLRGSRSRGIAVAVWTADGEVHPKPGQTLRRHWRPETAQPLEDDDAGRDGAARGHGPLRQRTRDSTARRRRAEALWMG